MLAYYASVQMKIPILYVVGAGFDYNSPRSCVYARKVCLCLGCAGNLRSWLGSFLSLWTGISHLKQPPHSSAPKAPPLWRCPRVN